MRQLPFLLLFLPLMGLAQLDTFNATFQTMYILDDEPDKEVLEYCKGDTVRFSFHTDFPTNYALIKSLVWTFSEGRILSQNEFSVDVFFLEEGNGYMAVELIFEAETVVYQKTSSGEEIYTIKKDFAYLNPEGLSMSLCQPKYTNFYADFTTICRGECISFVGQSELCPETYFWAFEGAQPATSMDQNPVEVCYDQPGKYAVTLQAGNKAGVDVYAKMAYIEVLDFPELVEEEIQHLVFGPGESLELNPCHYEPGYEWFPKTYMDCTDCTNPNISPEEEITYEYLNPLAPCEVACIVEVHRLKESRIYIPNAFSPNGDGVNDFFEIYGDHFQILDLSIYDRWGALVFQTRNSNFPWNGSRNGAKLLPGIYIYSLSYLDLVTQRPEQLQGDVFLSD